MPSPFFAQLLEIILPRSCIGCGRSGILLCSTCGPRQALSGRCAGCHHPSPAGLTHPRCRKRTALDGFTALAAYADPMVRRALLSAKYHGVFSFAEIFGARLGTAWLQAGLKRPGVLVPIPLHWSRERARGHNQSLLIAQGFSRATRLPVVPSLIRKRATRPQAKLDHENRVRNLASAFQVLPSVPKRAILIDDIYTSGATLESAAHILKVNGTQWVEVAVVAAETSHDR